MNRHLPLIVLLAAVVSSVSTADPNEPMKSTDSPVVVIGNIFVPGILQVTHGQDDGYLYMIGGPLLLGGAGLLTDHAMNGDDPSRLSELGVGLGAQEAGTSLASFSYYAYERDFLHWGTYGSLRHESYLDLLIAPYRLENPVSPEILPVLGLTVVPFLTYDHLMAISSYFSRSSVSFFGAQVTPSLGLVLESAYSLLVNLFVAVGEETLFRGFLLDRIGSVPSAVTFGLVHLGNAFAGVYAANENPYIDASIQSLGALSFGLYADFLIANDNGSLQKPIAYHYWNNVMSYVLGYLAGAGLGGP